MTKKPEAKATPPKGALEKIRKICLSLPNTKETLSWGSPHFRVGEKIFSGMGEEKGRGIAVGFKLEMDHADAMVQVPGFWRAPYVGKRGWVSMAVTPKTNWSQVKTFVEESYRLIAPKPRTPKATVARSRADNRKVGAGHARPATPRSPRKKAS